MKRQKRSLDYQNEGRLLIQQITGNGLRYARGPVHYTKPPVTLKPNTVHFRYLNGVLQLDFEWFKFGMAMTSLDCFVHK